MSVYGNRGPAVRLFYLGVALIYWLATLGGRFFLGRTVVLAYHGIRAEQQGRFEAQMRVIHEGVHPSTPRVEVTFDDTFACLIENALPVTSKLGIPVTIFVPTGKLGDCASWSMPSGHPEAGERVMTRGEIRQAHRPGLVDFGSHTCTHARLPQLTDAAMAAELTESREALEELLGVPVQDLALPYGEYDAAVLATARSVGYKRIYTLEEQLGKPSQTSPCGRFLMSPDAWLIEFRLTCAGAYSWLCSWRRFVRRLRACFRSAAVPRLSPT